jgi:hypothetical protein
MPYDTDSRHDPMYNCITNIISRILSIDEHLEPDHSVSLDQSTTSGLAHARIEIYSKAASRHGKQVARVVHVKAYRYPMQHLALESALIGSGLVATRLALHQLHVPAITALGMCSNSNSNQQFDIAVVVWDQAPGHTLETCFAQPQRCGGDLVRVVQAVGRAVADLHITASSCSANAKPRVIELQDLVVIEALANGGEAATTVPPPLSQAPVVSSPDLLEVIELMPQAHEQQTMQQATTNTINDTTLVFGRAAALQHIAESLPNYLAHEMLAMIEVLFAEAARSSKHIATLLHGDLSLSNILYDDASHTVSIVDWGRATQSFGCSPNMPSGAGGFALESLWLAQPCAYPNHATSLSELLLGNAVYDVAYLRHYMSESGIDSQLVQQLVVAYCSTIDDALRSGKHQYLQLACDAYPELYWQVQGLLVQLLLIPRATSTTNNT